MDQKERIAPVLYLFLPQRPQRDAKFFLKSFLALSGKRPLWFVYQEEKLSSKQPLKSINTNWLNELFTYLYTSRTFIHYTFLVLTGALWTSSTSLHVRQLLSGFNGVDVYKRELQQALAV